MSQVGYSFRDPSRAVDFFNSVLENRNRLGEEAAACIDSDIAVMYVKLGATEDARKLLDAIEEKLSGSKNAVLEDVDSYRDTSAGEALVFSRVYKATAEYRKVISLSFYLFCCSAVSFLVFQCVGPPSEFYKASLLFLAYTPADQIPSSEKYSLATDMALAALTGDGVFNFGEVIATPVLASLKGTPNEYLHDLVHAVNCGSIDNFNSLLDKHRDQYFSQEALKNCHEQVQQKVVLLALMNMVFELPSHERSISYAAIASVTRVPLEQV